MTVLETAWELSLSPPPLRIIICRALRVRPDPGNWSEYPNVWDEVQGLMYGCEWFKVYDIIEVMHVSFASNDRERGENDAASFAGKTDTYFVEEGIGWQLVDGQIVTRGTEAFESVATDAAAALDDTARPTAAGHTCMKRCRPFPPTEGRLVRRYLSRHGHAGGGRARPGRRSDGDAGRGRQAQPSSQEFSFMAKKKIDVEIMKLGPDHIMKWLDQLYDLVVEDCPFLESAQDIGNHYAAGTGSLEERARQLVRWQVTKAGTSGFLSGLGGVITKLVAIPANIASVMYVQIRMIAAVAHLGGHDIRNDQVRTLCYTCMCGKAAGDVVKNTGISLGTKLTSRPSRSRRQDAQEHQQEGGLSPRYQVWGERHHQLGQDGPDRWRCRRWNLDAASTYVIGKIARTTFIGTAAPKFNVVSKPNDSLSVAQAARATDDASLSETRRTQKAYWTAFHRVLDTSSGPIAGNRKRYRGNGRLSL